jgi:Flp pilus assembly pilin Flp
MEHGSKKGSRLRALAAEEKGGATMETALIAALGAIMALTMKELMALPLLSFLTKAMRVLSEALSN